MKQTERNFDIQFSALTDVGRKRNNNEDNYYCETLWDDNHLFAMVVDGVGGYAGGEVAARIAIEETVGYLEKYRDGERSRLMAEAFVHANNCIFKQRSSEDRLYRMCCVMTAALFDLKAGRIYMAHVGDTRMYACSEGRIIKLSHDHSMIGREEDAGYLTELEAMQNPYRNMVDKAVGEYPLDNATDFVETNVFPMGKGITWLFCSDGLTDMITSAQISFILQGDTSVGDKAKELVDAANEAGGRDNVTVVLVSTMGSADEETVQVMNDYAHNVLPERPEEEEESVIPELPLEEQEADDLSEMEPVTELVTESVAEPVVESQEKPIVETQPCERHKPLHRTFPWTPFILFMITILTAVITVWGCMRFGIMDERQDHVVPSLQEQQQQHHRLYYNINTLPLD